MRTTAPGVNNPCELATPRVKLVKTNSVAQRGLEHEAGEFGLPIAMVGVPIYTRLVRGIVLSVHGRECVEDA
jgi:ABC-type dipeptide/oligopeptide/nickel transport system permease subunit